MSKLEKVIQRLKAKPRDFTYEEMKMVLNNFGFIEYNRGKTSGSRVLFIDKNGIKIELYKPHPNNVLKQYQIKQILDKLNEWGMIKWIM